MKISLDARIELTGYIIDTIDDYNENKKQVKSDNTDEIKYIKHLCFGGDYFFSISNATEWLDEIAHISIDDAKCTVAVPYNLDKYINDLDVINRLVTIFGTYMIDIIDVDNLNSLRDVLTDKYEYYTA